MLTSVTLVMLLAWATAASAAPGWTVVPTVDPSAGDNVLNAVAVRGPADAWAVGRSRSATALIEHWNGSAWSIVPTRNATTSNLLTGVAAVTANNVWAVGTCSTA